MIFFLLGLIRSESLIPFYSTGAVSMIDTLELIIEWLQVGVSECNRQIP